MSTYIKKIRTASGDLQIDYNALANLPTTDTDLTTSGKAADAKVVGDKFNTMATKDYVDTTVSIFSNPNILINGDFQVWQRGTSFSNIENTYSADRWLIKNAKAKTFKVEKSTDVPSGQYMRQSVHLTETAEENTYLRYMFENSLKGTFTLSFWYKTSTAFSAFYYDNGDTIHLGNLTALNTWTKATFVINAVSMEWINVIHAMSSGDTYITGVKLEYGNVATVFVPRSYDEELLLCQRYFNTISGVRAIGVEHDKNAKTITYVIPRNCIMRATPTVSVSGTTTTNSTDGICVRNSNCALISGFTFTYTIRNGELQVVAKNSGDVAENCYETQLFVNDAFKFYLDAELY